MSYTYVSTAAQLETFCDELATAETIAFDTEFVSEHTYRSQLCLVQVCTPRQLAVIDPQTTGDLQRFWEVLARAGHQTVVHAGREELVFALHSVGKCPADLLDVQIAAGLMGMEYPAGYGSLLDRMLRVSAQKGETRTDWRKRPLSSQQIEYALDDVRYLIPLRDKITERLAKLGRLTLDAKRNGGVSGRNHRQPNARTLAPCFRPVWPVTPLVGGGAGSLALARSGSATPG